VTDRSRRPTRNGQLPTATLVETARVTVFEVWFDDLVWANDSFGTPAARDLLIESVFAPAPVRVTERIPIDQRTSA
jgi:hypothetical protein